MGVFVSVTGGYAYFIADTFPNFCTAMMVLPAQPLIRRYDQDLRTQFFSDLYFIEMFVRKKMFCKPCGLCLVNNIKSAPWTGFVLVNYGKVSIRKQGCYLSKNIVFAFH